MPEFTSLKSITDVFVTELKSQCAAQDLPLLQKIALMQMNISPIKGTLIARMSEDIQVRPGIVEYQVLVKRGWAQKLQGDRFHSLTYEGKSQAAALEQLLCREHNIHRLIEVGGAGMRDVIFKCHCGWRTYVAKGNFVESNARARFCAHLPERESPSIVPDGGDV